MDAAVALNVVQWVAVLVVYLGFAAVLREVRLLRAQVGRLQERLAASGPMSAADSGLCLPADVTGGRDGVLVVADTTCPACAAVVDHVAAHARAGVLSADVRLLTWQPEDDWADLARGLRVVRDSDAWSRVAHLSPPMLLRVDARGGVRDVVLPESVTELDPTLQTWGALRTASLENRGAP